MMKLPKHFHQSSEIATARAANIPIVALESTVLTHGLPEPINLTLSKDLEAEVRKNGAIPATIGVLNGCVRIGLSEDEIKELIASVPIRKISKRDYASVIYRKESGGTTVAGTLVAAHTAGIRVFATGGIGGVHRGYSVDVSSDLQELSQTPLVVVCAGAKAILDLPATLEVLETLGVPVIGYQTWDFPAFYARTSGLSVHLRAETPQEIAEIALTHWGIGCRSAVLVVVPPPIESALGQTEMESAVNQALSDAKEKNIRGQQVTPYLLRRVSELTGQASLTANLALLINNAKIAAKIAVEFHGTRPIFSA
jgi:pseudouridine-5'-phosphate glycosidase